MNSSNGPRVNDTIDHASSPNQGVPLHLSLDALKELVSSLPLNACLTDAQGRFLALSESYCHTSGYDRSELLGQSYLILVPPEKHQESSRRYASLFSDEHPILEATPRVRKDGSQVLARAYSQALTLEDGSRVLLSLVPDVSELELTGASFRVSEEQYRALAEQSYDAIVVVDQRGTVVNWSLGAERVFGIPGAQALGANLGELQAAAAVLDPAAVGEAERIGQQVRDFLAGNPSRWAERLFEHSIRRPDGSRAVVQTRVFPIQCDDTVLVGSISRDVTETRATEKALRKSLREQKRLCETARYLTASLELDVVLRRIAEEARDLVEAYSSVIYLLEPGGTVLRPMVAIEPPYEKEILAAPLDVEQSFTGQAVKLRRGMIFNDARDNPLGQYIEGTPLDIEERIMVVPFVAEGEVLGAMCLSRQGPLFDDEDLTLAETLAAYAATALRNARTHDELRRQMEERRRVEIALSDREAQFRALADNSQDLITRIDQDLRHVYANPAIVRILGWRPEEVIGKTYHEMGFPSEVSARLAAAAEEVFCLGRPRRQEIELGSAAGPLYLDWHLVPEFGPDGAVTTVLCTARDISDIKRAEIALQESERFLSTLMSNLPGMVYRCASDSDWTMIYVSEGCRELTGYAPEELVANARVAFGDLIHPDDRQAAQDYITAAVAAGSSFQLEYRIFDQEGREKWVWERGRFARTDGDQSVLEGFITDITERKRAEQTHEAMQAISEAALTCGSLEELGSAIHDVVRRLMPAPNLYLALRDPASGWATMVYFCDEKESMEYGPRQGCQGVTEYILRTGRPLLADRQRIEELYEEGEVVGYSAIPESYLGLPLRNQEGLPVGVLAVQCYDAAVTYSEREQAVLEFVSGPIALAFQRRLAEEAVREERDFAQNLLNTTQSIILLLDLEGRVVSYNRYTETLTGCPVEQAKGREWANFFVPERGRDAVHERIRKVIERGSVRGDVGTVLAQDGKEHLIEWHATPMTDRQGNVVGVLATGYDITERKRLEEELLQSQKMETIGRLAGGVAHDFNNLLTAIIGHAQFALEGLPAGDPTGSDLREVLRAADRAAGLTRQLLAFSRRQIIETRPVDLGELVLHTDKMVRRLIGENIELVTTCGPEPCVVLADPAQIEQVLVNLVVNARDAMPNGGRLEIEVRAVSLDACDTDQHVDVRPGEYVQLSVADTGIGMTDEVKSHLFEPFFTTKGPDKGTGLGLATVYGIVRQHRGSIQVHSEVGRGATLRVLLPRVGESAERLPRRDEAGFLPLGGETVLVVEDEPLVRKVVARTLSEQGYAVLQAGDGQEALQVAREHAGTIDLLITDVIMPQMGGKELANRLREIRPDVAVLYVSGYADSTVTHGGLLEEGTAFLQKPFSVAALARKVREVLDARK